MTIAANATNTWSLLQFPAGVAPPPGTQRFIRLTNIVFPAGFNPGTPVLDIKYLSKFFPLGTISGVTTPVFLEQATWTNPFSVTVTISVSLFGINP